MIIKSIENSLIYFIFVILKVTQNLELNKTEDSILKNI